MIYKSLTKVLFENSLKIIPSTLLVQWIMIDSTKSNAFHEQSFLAFESMDPLGGGSGTDLLILLLSTLGSLW
jgi:hypothetical protein